MQLGRIVLSGLLLALAPAVAGAVEIPAPPSFADDVVPVLTRFGCSMGACHGKLAGQNGFRLSLRGYAPDFDHKTIAREENQRRINVADPAHSLLLLKPSGKVPHAGGRLLEAGSPGYQVLQNWIATGAPGPVEKEATVARIEVSPRTKTMKVGETQPLTVTAHYTDGRVRDVTWLTKFDSNDASLVPITAEGVVRAARHGETSIRAAFRDQVEIATFTIPYEHAVDDSLFAERRNVIDNHVFDKLKGLHIEPSPNADDAAFLRRVYLDTIGTLPTPDEARAFLADQDAAKRAKLIDQLIERPEFVDFWTLQFGDLLQNRKERDHDVRGPKGVRQMHAWLRAQVAANRPWNELARDVLTASGSEKNNPAVGYFVVTVGERQAPESEVADSVAQAFLGTRIGCAKCHNHPLEKYTQDDYYHFVAFFSRVSMDRKDSKEGPTELWLVDEHAKNLMRQMMERQKQLDEAKAKNEDAKKIEELTKQLADLEKQKTDHLKQPVQVRQPRTGQMMVAQPLDRSAVDLPPDVDPRSKLVEWMTRPDNEAFAGAMVNRLWKHFFSVGLVEPVDDLRATNPPSNPELWKAMVSEFKQSNYNVRHVMKLILNSRAYQLASDTKPANATETRYYSHYYARRLPAEVMLDAISSSTGVPDTFQGYPVGVRAVQLPGPQIESYFLSLFGRSDRVTACACERNGDVTLPQLLHLQNGDSITNKLGDPTGRLNPLLDKEADNDKVIDELFLSTFNRPPRDDERGSVKKALEGADRREVFSDLFWALLNSKEFAFNH
jgi:hypothetical protein